MTQPTNSYVDLFARYYCEAVKITWICCSVSSNVSNEAVYSLNFFLLSFEMKVEQSYKFFVPKGYYIIIIVLQTVLLQHEKYIPS